MCPQPLLSDLLTSLQSSDYSALLNFGHTNTVQVLSTGTATVWMFVCLFGHTNIMQVLILALFVCLFLLGFYHDPDVSRAMVITPQN